MSGSDFGLAAPATRIGHTFLIGTFTPRLDRGGGYLDAAKSGNVVSRMSAGVARPQSCQRQTFVR
jgi:hypothetical protein